jgi:hypothetical protein
MLVIGRFQPDGPLPPGSQSWYKKGRALDGDEAGAGECGATRDGAMGDEHLAIGTVR